MFAREVAKHRIAFEDSTRTIAGHKTGGDVDQRGAFHPARKGNHILSANDIGAQTAFQRGIERNFTGRVDQNIDVLGNCSRLFFTVPKIGLRYISTLYDDFVTDEAFESATIAIAQRIKGRLSNDVVPKTGF